jgi:outer membrane protein assembly factor BamB
MNNHSTISFYKNTISIFFIVIFISSCSSMSSLKFWESNDDDDDDAPKELIKTSNNFSINEDWKISFNGENILGNFVPAFGGKDIYFADTSGLLNSIDTSSGKVNWETESNFLSSGVSSGFGILIVSDIDGNVIAQDQQDGSVLWTTNVKGEVLAPPAISATHIIVKTGSGELLGLDKKSGELKWSYRSKLPALTIRGSSSPIIVENQIYVSFDNGRLGVFELDSGFPLWDGAISYQSGSSELESLNDSDSEPYVEGGLVYTTNYQGNLNIFDIAQKRSVWSSEVSSFYSPILTKGMLVVVKDNSVLKSFTLKTLEDSWESGEYKNREISNAVSFNGNLIFGDLEGYIHAVDPLNGKTISRTRISKKPIKKIISRSNNFYAVDEGFNLFSLSI